MKRASFTAGIVICLAALLFWNIPGAFPWVIALSGVALIPAIILYARFPTIPLRDLTYVLICLLISTVILWFPVNDFYDTVESYDGVTVKTTVTLTEDPVQTDSGLYLYTARPPRQVFRQKFVFFSEKKFSEAGGTVTAKFSFHTVEQEHQRGNYGEGIALSATLNTPEDQVEYTEASLSFYSVSGAIRRYTHRILVRYIGLEEGGFMTAVLTGNDGVLTEEHRDVLTETGMVHIVAVSGLHVSIFVAFVLFLLRGVRNLHIRMLASLLILFVILLFSGFTPSVCRAVIMNAVLFIGEWLALGSDPFNRLGIAAVLILLFRPYAILSLSFQLSFAAALGILLFGTPFTKAAVMWLFQRFHVICGSVLRNLISLSCVSVAAFLLTLPLMWIFFDSYSVWSVYLSPVVLPVLEVCFFGALILLLLSLLPFLSFLCGWIGEIIRYGVKYMTYLAGFAVEFMDMVETVPPALKWIVAGACLLLAVLLFFLPAVKTTKKKARKNLVGRGLALVLLAIALLTAYQAAESASSDATVGDVSPTEGVLQTAFLDVGQGNCFVNVFGDEACVVDCGGTKDPGLVAADYLTQVGIDTVKFVLISHLHDDHANGLEDLCAEKEILEIIIPYTEGDAGLYAKITALAAEEGAELTVIEEDTVRTLGEATLRLLTKHLDPTSDDQNENSIVGLCEYGNFRAMFTGDITSKAERRLVSAYGNGLDCDVLSVPHHGSKSSSCDTFLQACSPVYAVISVGAKNNYGHPTQEALLRIAETGAELFRTDTMSTVIVRSDGQNMEVHTANES